MCNRLTVLEIALQVSGENTEAQRAVVVNFNPTLPCNLMGCKVQRSEDMHIMSINEQQPTEIIWAVSTGAGLFSPANADSVNQALQHNKEWKILAEVVKVCPEISLHVEVYMIVYIVKTKVMMW